MSLSDIKDKLYKKNASKNLSEHEISPYDPNSPRSQDHEGKPEEADLWKEKNKGLGEYEKKLLKRGLVILSGVLFIIVGTVVGFEIRRWMFSESSASVSISGPDQAKSGRLLIYEIAYKNDNRVDINDVEIKISYPEGFKPDENPDFKEESPTSGTYYLGTVKSHTGGKVVLNGKAYSPKGALIYLKVNLAYRPSNYSSQFNTRTQIGVSVISAPITLEIQAPQNVPSGDAVDYLISYRNDGVEAMPSFKIKVDYPEQFSYSRSEPFPSEGDNIWYIGSLEPNQSGKIVVSGKLEGEREKIKSVKVFAGMTQKGEFIVLNEESANTKIVVSAFSIAQTVNGLSSLNANPGDTLEFKITYRNDSDIGFRDVIITEKLDSPVLDYTTLNIPGGSFDRDNNLITWKTPDIPGLKNLGPGEEGLIAFSVRVKKVIAVAGGNDKNFIISSLAKIDSPDVPTPISMNKIISGNEMNIRLNSKLILDVAGYYNDSSIPNSGPTPPRVGQETTYTLHWKITNISNDLAETKVTAMFPTDAKMTGKIYPEDTRITYNERDNSILWDVGSVKAGTGVLNPPLEAAFQVKIKPAPSQIGKEVRISGVPSVVARDTFTGETLEKKGDSKTTNLIEDKGLAGDGRVVAE